MGSLRDLVLRRTYALAFAVALSPAVLQTVPPGCEPGDGTLSTLELNVAADNHIAFDPEQLSYEVWLLSLIHISEPTRQ